MRLFRLTYTDFLVSWLLVYFSGKILFDTVPLVFELFSLAVIAFCAIQLVFSKSAVSLHRVTLFIVFILFSLYVFFNALLQNTFSQLARSMYEYIFYMLIFFAMIWLLSHANLQKCIKILAVWGILVACLSWFEFITKHHLIVDLGIDINAGFRATVFSRSYLTHGMILGFFAIACMDISYAEKKPLWFLAGMFCYISILTTGSRGPLVACGVALVIQFMLNAYNSRQYSYKRFIACTLLGCSVLAALIVMFGTFETPSETINNFLRRIRSIFNWTGDPGNVGRLHLWNVALDWFKSNIWFGIGPSKTGTWGEGSIGVTESGVLKRLCELGLIGFVLYYFFVICIIIKGIRTYRNQDTTGKQRMTFWFAIAIAVLINDCTVQSTEEIMISFYMWTAFAGLEVATLPILKKKQQSDCFSCGRSNVDDAEVS